MKFLKKKRAQSEHELYFLLFDIILATIVLLILINYISSLENSTIYDKNYLSRDIAMVLDIVYMSPGNIYYEYDYAKKPIFGFNYYFRSTSTTEENTVSVSDTLEQAKSNTQASFMHFSSYPYAANKGIINDLQILSAPEKIFFVKSGNIISNREKRSLNTLKCSNPETEKKPKTILIDIISDTEAEKKLFSKFLLSMQSKSYSGDQHILFAKSYNQENSEITESNNIANLYLSADAVILFSLSKEIKNSNFIKSYYLFFGENYPEIQYLGCSMLNAVLSSGREFMVSNIPSDINSFKVISDRIRPDTRIIRFEIGLTGTENKEDMIASLSDPIFEVLKNQ